MFYDSVQFKAMESGIQAMTLKQEVHTQNIANVDTPDYKSKEFTFSSVLEDKLGDDKNDGKVSYSFGATVTEQEELSVLLDGNNVDLDAEGLELYSAYLQQAAIIQKMNSVFADNSYVLSNANFK